MSTLVCGSIVFHPVCHTGWPTKRASCLRAASSRYEWKDTLAERRGRQKIPNSKPRVAWMCRMFSAETEYASSVVRYVLG